MQLIDRDKLRAALENAIKSSEDNNNTITGWHYRAGLKSALVCLMNVPVVEERKHGHWIETNEYYTGAYESLYYYKCSVCGAVILEDVDFGVGNYCQQCGAKMDGENNG